MSLIGLHRVGIQIPSDLPDKLRYLEVDLVLEERDDLLARLNLLISDSKLSLETLHIL